MSRKVLILVVIAGVLGAVTWLYRGDLALAVMQRGAAANLGSDRIAELPDGLHVLFCGAGSPMPDPQRSGPCVAVIAGKAMVVVDAGTNGARNLQRMGFGPGRVAALFLTHFHSDHIDGLGELAMLRWVGAAHTAPLPVHGPNGVEQIVEGFNLAYRADFGYRTAHHGEAIAPPSGAGSRAVAFEPPADGTPVIVWEHGGLTVTAFTVGHEPVEPAVGYRFDYAGRSVVISGDTRKVDAVASVARGTDLLVHEALAPHMVGLLQGAAEAAGLPGLAKITQDILDYHASPVEAAEVAKAAGVGTLVYHHIVPPLLVPGAEAAFLRGVDRAYDGNVYVARDGLLLSLPAGSADVRRAQRL
ncbi:MAG: MBL fold metallo-hydrolase [Pseudomonadales bacterium]|nr:MBL fold metallo-hydrolase [Pseudomonadales bacterium]